MLQRRSHKLVPGHLQSVPSRRSGRRESGVVLRPGMYAVATILLDQRENVLTLPVAAIVRDGGKTFCCCVMSGKIDRRKIELGLRSGDEVEIVSGLRRTNRSCLLGPIRSNMDRPSK